MVRGLGLLGEISPLTAWDLPRRAENLPYKHNKEGQSYIISCSLTIFSFIYKNDPQFNQECMISFSSK